MVSPGTPSRAKLAPRLTIPARDALLSFVFDDARSDDPVMDFGDRWCEWDGGPPAPAEVLETTGVDAHARTRVTIALAPNATHLAVARGRRLAVVATRAVSEKHADAESADREAFARARTCLAEVSDASGPDPEAYVTCMCWLAFAEPRPAGAAARPRADASAAAVADLSVAIGTSDGCLRVYAADGILLLSKRLDFGSGPDGAPSPVRAVRARDARRSPSRDEVSEDLVAALDAAATKVDAVELRSALRRAHMLRGATQSQARFRASADLSISLPEDAHAPLATTRWDLARLAPVADAVSVGRLPPSVARAGLARADGGEPGGASIGGVSAASRGVGVLAAGLGDPRGDSGVVCLLASYDDDDAGVLDAAAALARKTASAAAATVSSLFGGAVSLAGAVTKSLPVGRALGGAVVGAVEKAGHAAGSAAAEASGVAGVVAGADDDARPLTWRSAWIDPPRRTRRFAPAPRGPLVAAADGLGRVAVLDVAAPATLATARVIKGCRDAEMAWVEAPPPRGSNARLVAATGGLGALFLAVRSPRRNGGAVELWRCAGVGGVGGVGGMGKDEPEPGERGPNPDRDRDRDGDTNPFSAARLLQAATPFGAEAATSSPAAAVALAVAASKCYLLTPDGTLSEVLAP
jgi:hypothetical protein